MALPGVPRSGVAPPAPAHGPRFCFFFPFFACFFLLFPSPPRTHRRRVSHQRTPARTVGAFFPSPPPLFVCVGRGVPLAFSVGGRPAAHAHAHAQAHAHAHAHAHAAHAQARAHTHAHAHVQAQPPPPPPPPPGPRRGHDGAPLLLLPPCSARRVPVWQPPRLPAGAPAAAAAHRDGALLVAGPAAAATAAAAAAAAAAACTRDRAVGATPAATAAAAATTPAGGPAGRGAQWGGGRDAAAAAAATPPAATGAAHQLVPTARTRGGGAHLLADAASGPVGRPVAAGVDGCRCHGRRPRRRWGCERGDRWQRRRRRGPGKWRRRPRGRPVRGGGGGGGGRDGGGGGWRSGRRRRGRPVRLSPVLRGLFAPSLPRLPPDCCARRTAGPAGAAAAKRGCTRHAAAPPQRGPSVPAGAAGLRPPLPPAAPGVWATAPAGGVPTVPAGRCHGQARGAAPPGACVACRRRCRRSPVRRESGAGGDGWPPRPPVPSGCRARAGHRRAGGVATRGAWRAPHRGAHPAAAVRAGGYGAFSREWRWCCCCCRRPAALRCRSGARRRRAGAAQARRQPRRVGGAALPVPHLWRGVCAGVQPQDPHPDGAHERETPLVPGVQPGVWGKGQPGAPRGRPPRERQALQLRVVRRALPPKGPFGGAHVVGARGGAPKGQEGGARRRRRRRRPRRWRRPRRRDRHVGCRGGEGSGCPACGAVCGAGRWGACVWRGPGRWGPSPWSGLHGGRRLPRRRCWRWGWRLEWRLEWRRWWRRRWWHWSRWH
ncbi:hypothetical protein I4F81_009095 [Pyropia yezoensis]|uniref:Uncharacterized protein n=1 Tax=Pyropia yezoensis TaxID=2788 RepID=A0ACC3C8W6_PYRYE|nr:hypothetical protein I4F81_009095 [Neopyropia yezoensis]